MACFSSLNAHSVDASHDRGAGALASRFAHGSGARYRGLWRHVSHPGADDDGSTDPQRLIALPVPGSDVWAVCKCRAAPCHCIWTIWPLSGSLWVIDGQLARQGARLEGGGRVVQVRPSEAVVTERLGRQTLTLPQGELRVGTLRWPDGSWQALIPRSSARVCRADNLALSRACHDHEGPLAADRQRDSRFDVCIALWAPVGFSS